MTKFALELKTKLKKKQIQRRRRVRGQCPPLPDGARDALRQGQAREEGGGMKKSYFLILRRSWIEREASSEKAKSPAFLTPLSPLFCL